MAKHDKGKCASYLARSGRRQWVTVLQNLLIYVLLKSSTLLVPRVEEHTYLY
jgi:hypothetical protein